MSVYIYINAEIIEKQLLSEQPDNTEEQDSH